MVFVIFATLEIGFAIDLDIIIEIIIMLLIEITPIINIILFYEFLFS